MKYWKHQIRLADYCWLKNQAQQRVFCLIGKTYEGTNEQWRVKSYTILEVGHNNPKEVAYELMENLIETKSFIVL
jgi:hypothetical protein